MRRGLRVSSASGAAASNPPNARTARLKASSTSLEPPGQWNGVADRPLAPPLARIVRTTVTRTPNFSPTITGATTSAP